MISSQDFGRCEGHYNPVMIAAEEEFHYADGERFIMEEDIIRKEDWRVLLII